MWRKCAFWRPLAQLLASCWALRPGWPVEVPHPPAETQAPLSGTPGARVHSHALPSWAQRGFTTRSAQLGDPQSPRRDPSSCLSGHCPRSCLPPPILQGCSLDHSSPHYTSAGCSFIPGAPLTAQGGGLAPALGLKEKELGGVLAYETVGSTGGVPLGPRMGLQIKPTETE